MTSTSISQVLRSFVRGVPGVPNRCYMLIYPNPLLYTGLAHANFPTQTSYLLSFGRGHDDVMVSGKNAWAICYSKNYNSFLTHQDKFEFSEWITIANNRNTRRTKRSLREKLIEVLEIFPQQCLDSREDVENAGWELESRINDASERLQETQQVVGEKVELE